MVQPVQKFIPVQIIGKNIFNHIKIDRSINPYPANVENMASS